MLSAHWRWRVSRQFAGFFSKDEVLLATFQRNKLAWFLATFAAFLTAFYMTRQIFMVFFGNWRGGRPRGASAQQARRSPRSL